jgi:hypothetical protein
VSCTLRTSSSARSESSVVETGAFSLPMLEKLAAAPYDVEPPCRSRRARVRRLPTAHPLPKPSRFTSTHVDPRRERSESISPSVSRRWLAKSRAA